MIAAVDAAFLAIIVGIAVFVGILEIINRKGKR